MAHPVQHQDIEPMAFDPHRRESPSRVGHGSARGPAIELPTQARLEAQASSVLEATQAGSGSIPRNATPGTPPPAPSSLLDRMRQQWPMALSRSVMPEVTHYRASAPMGLLTGQAWQLLTGPSLYDFIESVRGFADARTGGTANFEPISFFLGATPCLLVQDDRDLKSVFQTDKMTQGSTAAVPSAPLSLFETLVGRDFNVLLLNPYGDDGKRDPAYAQARSLFVPFAHNVKALDAFFSETMPGLLRRHLDRWVDRGEGVELTKLTQGITLDVGGRQVSALNRQSTADFYLGDATIEGMSTGDVQHLLENFLSLVGDPKLYLQPWKTRSAMSEARETMSKFSLALLEANYDSVRDLPGFITKRWKAAFPEIPFPATFEALEALRDTGDERQAQAWDDFVMAIGFAQLAASETTGQAANFMLRELLLRPQWLARLREEADGVDLTTPTMDTLKLLPHASHFVQETLRMHPPVAIAPWAAAQPIQATLQGQPVTIPKGTWVFFDNERANRSAWERGAEFDPTRWEGGPDMPRFLSNLPQDQTGFHSFSGSTSTASRVCAGLKLAAPELVFILATVVKHYDIEALGPVSVERHSPSTLKPLMPLEVKLQPRLSS